MNGSRQEEKKSYKEAGCVMRDPEVVLEYICRFTDTYRQCTMEGTGIEEREIRCLEVMLPYTLEAPQPEDLFAGRLYYPEVGVSPEPLGGRGVCFNYDVPSFDALEQAFTGEKLARVKEIRAFWEQENTRHKIRQAFPQDIAETLPWDDDYYKVPDVAFPLYRTVGIYIDYDKLLSLGIGGLKRLALARRDRALREGDEKAVRLMEAMAKAMDLFTQACLRYAKQFAALGREDCAQVLRAVAENPPATFREAAQLSFLYTRVCGSLNHGRMDVYLGDFYAADLSAGRITPEEGLAVMQGIFRLIAARQSVFHGRVIVGGMGRRNEENADQVALLAIEACRTVLEPEPQFTLRFYQGQNPLLMEKALDCIGEGRTYPILYNDDVNVPAVEKAFCLPREEAVDYLPLGCGEYVIDHKSFGSPNGIINLLKALEVTMRNGWDIISQKDMGLKLGRFEDFSSFEDFYSAYKKQLAHYVDALARQEVIEYQVVARQTPFLYMSMLYDDCVERGRAIFDGGIRYLGGTLETYGNVNTANSLLAIKKCVFEEKRIGQDTLMKALDNDFRGYEEVQKLLLDAPKYGNDDDEADAMAVDLHEYLCTLVRDQKEKTSLHSYLVVIINNKANTQVGQFTGASADGRNSGVFLANANAPMGGTDKKGVTALLNSMVKLTPDLHAGAVQNMKFSKEFFNGKRPLAAALLRAYFQNGGTQAMITVLGRGDLENAVAHPEQYRSLMVRVGGFSARFVDLTSDVQQEIMSRTLY